MTFGVACAIPLASPAPAQLADCLYDKNHNFINSSSSNLLATADIVECTNCQSKRDLPRIDPGPGYSSDEIIAKRAIQAPPLIVPGEQVAAKITRRGLEAREPPPAVGFFDQTGDRPNLDVIPTNFLEAGNLEREWSTPICSEITKVDPHQTTKSGTFNYNIQGTHKKGITLVHDKRYLHLLVTFTPMDTENLPKYDLMDLCKNAIHQAAQTTHELKYGFFNKQTVYSIVAFHKIMIQPVQTPEQAHRRSTFGEPFGLVNIQKSDDPQKRSSFGSPYGLINLQVGDEAKDVAFFKKNGLP